MPEGLLAIYLRAHICLRRRSCTAQQPSERAPAGHSGQQHRPHRDLLSGVTRLLRLASAVPQHAQCIHILWLACMMAAHDLLGARSRQWSDAATAGRASMGFPCFADQPCGCRRGSDQRVCAFRGGTCGGGDYQRAIGVSGGLARCRPRVC